MLTRSETGERETEKEGRATSGGSLTLDHQPPFVTCTLSQECIQIRSRREDIASGSLVANGSP